MKQATIEGLAEYLQQGHGRLAEFERASKLSRTTVRRIRGGGKVHKASMKKAIAAFEKILNKPCGEGNVLEAMAMQLKAIDEYIYLNPEKAPDRLIELLEELYENRFQYAQLLKNETKAQANE